MKSILLALVFALLAQPAAAQSIKRCTEIFEQVKTEKLGDAAPFFAINTRGALRHDCWIITIYALEQKDPGDFSAPTLYFAKEWYAAHDDEPRVRYADIRKCDNMWAALDTISSFQLPHIRVPEEWPSDMVVISTDGQYSGIWTNRLPNSDDPESRSFLEFSLGDSNNDSFDRLSNILNAVLSPCWQTAMPDKP